MTRTLAVAAIVLAVAAAQATALAAAVSPVGRAVQTLEAPATAPAPARPAFVERIEVTAPRHG